ncbi:sulfotransferase family protein [Roseicyclus mahoneyensis]|uniref:Sulfotransferase family protein n=1 Tax=Roseicyclus mahoneyensis TaxID=164332 RepID=A0A316GHQ1_9RHOB|nr:sulfotransferase [Roseicyclus mahoneyensis]PWK60111.1 sulfotransferase family protein [Roseicyclus mahoneyensis]
MTPRTSGTQHDADTTPAADDRPLFIVGCVRSGTTLTRDLLRRVPSLICPEETHFFRWSEPFRTPHSFAPYRHNQLLKKHREIDGVIEEDFEAILQTSRSKAELQRNYITAFARAKGITGPYRWFDKTPQNVYGAPLIAQQMPNARFLNLVRNPLNVVASLVLGRQVKIPDVHGACNYWNESVQIMTTMEAAYPDRILTMRYEDLIADVPAAMAQILGHAHINAPTGLYNGADAHDERNLWRKALDADALSAVRLRCSALARRFGYDIEADLG